jgi:hypothetical protein
MFFTTLLAIAWLLLAAPANADLVSSCTTTVSGTVSCTGMLDTPEDVFEKSFTVTGAGASIITIQTFGFGGGTNAAGNGIALGGFDSMVALFSGLPATAAILTDGAGNPIASVPGSTQFFAGCPPAGMVSIGGSPVCGDNTLTASLLPGIYTLVLSDANYLPFAVSPGPPTSSLLSDGFADLSGGVFQTCNSSGACLSDINGNFAVDITGIPLVATPEPRSLVLLAGILAALLPRMARLTRRAFVG